jgi:predicted outer membrane protein
MLARRARRSGHRRRGIRLLVAVSLGLLVAALPTGVPAHAQVDENVVDTEWGPLADSDRELLRQVKFAGLWEIPAGQMAIDKGADPRVVEVGGFIRDEHIELDEMAEEAATKLGVTLPTEPFANHQVFLDRMEAKDGEAFDLEFIQRLREAHGAIYPVIAYTRAGTQNELVREFAQVGEDFVGRHMDYLESTGLVDWVHIPPAPGPAGAPSRFLTTAPGGVNPIVIWVMLGAAAIAGAITVVRTVRPR